MLKEFYPDIHMSSVFAVDYSKLYLKGCRGILFDLDNTLVHHGDDSTEEVDALFRTIHDIGLKTIIVSDNSDERIRSFLKNIDSPYISEAGKPDPAAYMKALQILGISKEQAVCVGDQVFRDIRGANRAGIASILVDFIRVPYEKGIGKKRWVEKFILFCWRMNRHHRNRIGNVGMEEKL